MWVRRARTGCQWQAVSAERPERKRRAGAGGAEKRTLVLDRTNWKIGEKDVNILVLAVATRHSQAPLMWMVLDRAGNSGAPERMELIERTIAAFGKDSIGMLPGAKISKWGNLSGRTGSTIC